MNAPRKCTGVREEEQGGHGRPALHGLAGHVAALLVPDRRDRRRHFEDGLGFDGSSIRGWQAINESDMLMVPDAVHRLHRPLLQHPTLVLICDIVDPITKEPYSRDPRWIAKKAENYLKSDGHRRHGVLRARGRVLPLQRRALPHQHRTRATTTSTRSRASGTRARRRRAATSAYKPRHKEGYFPVPPTDSLQDIRTRWCSRCSSSASSRGAPPRGRHRRAVRDRHALRHAGADGRPAAHLQVRGEERRARARPHRDLHAEAALRGQRHGHARAPVDLEGRQTALRRRRLRGLLASWASGTSAAS